MQYLITILQYHKNRHIFSCSRTEFRAIGKGTEENTTPEPLTQIMFPRLKSGQYEPNVLGLLIEFKLSIFEIDYNNPKTYLMFAILLNQVECLSEGVDRASHRHTSGN